MRTKLWAKLRWWLFRGGTEFVLMGCALSCVALAQSTAELPEAPSAGTQPAIASVRLQPGQAGFVPLTGAQRADLFFKGYLGSPGTYFASAGAASGGLIFNDPKEWHRTVKGYSERVGTTFALFTIQEGVHDAGDAALGLDPRYFRCLCTGGWHRAGNAIKMTLLAYDGNGHTHLDLPQIAGAYGSGMIVTTWYPSHYSPLVQGVQMGHAQLGLEAGVNLVREFSPELKRFFRHLKPQ